MYRVGHKFISLNKSPFFKGLSKRLYEVYCYNASEARCLREEDVQRLKAVEMWMWRKLEI